MNRCHLTLDDIVESRIEVLVPKSITPSEMEYMLILIKQN
jgi:hypothetical protein